MHVKHNGYPSSTPDFRCGASSWPIKPHARDEGRGFAPSLWLAVLVAYLLNAAGCGGSSGGNSVASPTPTATATAAVQEGAIFAPVFPPLSPNTVGFATSSQQAVSSDRVQLAAAAATAAPVTLNHYFYLVNGSGLPTPGPDGVRPNPSSTPSVLTVSGPAPNGAPNQNGGTGVGVEPLNPDATGRQLWKAVGAANGYFFSAAPRALRRSRIRVLFRTIQAC